MDDRTVSAVIGGLRALLTAIDAGQMPCSAAYRNRLQGAVVALEELDDSPSNDRLQNGPSEVLAV